MIGDLYRVRLYCSTWDTFSLLKQGEILHQIDSGELKKIILAGGINRTIHYCVIKYHNLTTGQIVGITQKDSQQHLEKVVDV